MDYASILNSNQKSVDAVAAAKRRQRAMSALPAAPTHPPVTDLEDNEEAPISNDQGARAQAAVYATAQEGTVAGFPVQPPNY